jgi:hypothetical protein
MAKGREKSDDRVVPDSLRKKGETAAAEQQGGKAVTANEQAKQLELFGETADSPQGADAGTDRVSPCLHRARCRSRQTRRETQCQR